MDVDGLTVIFDPPAAAGSFTVDAGKEHKEGSDQFQRWNYNSYSPTVSCVGLAKYATIGEENSVTAYFTSYSCEKKEYRKTYFEAYALNSGYTSEDDGSCDDGTKYTEGTYYENPIWTVHCTPIHHNAVISVGGAGNAYCTPKKPRHIANVGGDFSFVVTCQPKHGFRFVRWYASVSPTRYAEVTIENPESLHAIIHVHYKTPICTETSISVTATPDVQGKGDPHNPPAPGIDPVPDDYSYVYINGSPDDEEAFTSVGVQNYFVSGPCGGATTALMSCEMAEGYEFLYWIDQDGNIVSRNRSFTATGIFPPETGDINCYYYTAVSKSDSSSSDEPVPKNVMVLALSDPECRTDATGGGLYLPGESVTLSSIACCCPFVFAYWLDWQGSRVDDEELTFTIPEDPPKELTCTALFDHPTETGKPYHEDDGSIVCDKDGNIFYDGDKIKN